MNNWKIPTALSLFIISGIELLVIKDNYHLSKSFFLLGMEILFLMTVGTAAFLFLRGLLGRETE